jgi:hypothetical protein
MLFMQVGEKSYVDTKVNISIYCTGRVLTLFTCQQEL